MTKIAVIGAGLSGLTVATLLKGVADVTVFEKARGVSGRMSTRRAPPYVFDHGAQYFTVRTEAFRDFLQSHMDSGLIKRWAGRYVKFDGNEIVEKKDWRHDEPRFVGVPSMNRVAKTLAQELSIKIKTRVSILKRTEKWALFDENNTFLGDFDWVISTAPSPQTLDLVPEEFKYYQTIKQINMEPCFSLMLGFSSPLPLEFEAAHVMNSDISWLSVNSSKPGREDQPFALVVHSSSQYAQNHIEEDSDKILRHLSAEASQITGQDLDSADYKTLHRWRFASSPHHDTHPILIDERLKMGVCGDWVAGGRVEGAFVSAKDLCQKVKEFLT